VTSATENNGNPRRHRIIETGGLQREQQFSFDAANLLMGMTEGGGTGSLLNQSFHFDAHGNRWVTSPNSTISGPASTPQASGAFDPATNRFSTAVMQEQFDAAGHTTVTELGAIASECVHLGSYIWGLHLGSVTSGTGRARARRFGREYLIIRELLLVWRIQRRRSGILR